MKLSRKKGMTAVSTSATSDVAFLLLIFIMLVSLINYRKEIKIDYPEARAAVTRVNEQKNLEIWVNYSGEIFIDGEKAVPGDIERAIDNLYHTAPETRVHILADKNTPFENVNNVLQILQLLEYRVVTFVVKDS